MFYNSSTGHFYAYVSAGGSITWDQARTRALSMYCEPLECYGYLAHITSQQEQNFFYTLADKNAQGWLGAHRNVGSNAFDWYWMDGPSSERNAPFFRQNGVGGTLLWGYQNWDDGEPNNAGDETAMHYYGTKNGLWNDYSPSNPNVTGFIVEWGDDDALGIRALPFATKSVWFYQTTKTTKKWRGQRPLHF